MSVTTDDRPPFLFAQPGDSPSPYEYTVTGRGRLETTSATATFDGTAAASPFLAALSFYSQSGQLLSRVFPQTQVAAGDVATVSYAPFPGGMTSGGGGSGAQQWVDSGFFAGVAFTGGVPLNSGFGASAAITPVNGGPIICVMVMQFARVAGVGGGTVILEHGTGTPPAANTAASGTAIGSSLSYGNAAVTGGAITQVALLTGSTIGVTVWFDAIVNTASTWQMTGGHALMIEQ